jgi:periodic tryptophan protein 1
VFSASWSPDDVLTLAAAGSKGKLQIWDVATNGGARRTLAGKIQEAGRALREKTGDGVVGVVSDDEDDSDVEEED